MAQVKILIWNTETNKAINENYLIDSENLPIQGLDPKYKAYIYHIPFPPAPIETRKFIAVTTRTRVEELHPIYGVYPTYLETYGEEIRSNEELIIEVENAKKAANQSINNGYDMDKIIESMIVVNDKKIKKNSLEAWEVEIETLFLNIAAKKQNNEAVKDAKIAQINAGLGADVDFEQGWIIE